MKRIVSLILAVALCLSLGVTAFAADPAAANDQAQALAALNLLRGTNNGFELERAPTRMEALILMIRLMGRESDAFMSSGEHPFTDAPTWYDAPYYLSYAWENGMTKGVSADKFDPNSQASAQMLVTFVLRALGYTDEAAGAGGVWANWQTLGEQAGILPAGVDTKNFLRADAVLVLYAALNADMQDQELPTSLARNLLERGVFGEYDLEAARVIAGTPVSVSKSSLTALLAAIYKDSGRGFAMRTYYQPIDSDNLSYFLGVSELDFVEGMASEPMMMAQAHSVCLVRVKDGVDVEQAKKDIAASVDPRKWICVGVEPEGIQVVSRGNLILLVMDNNYAKAMAESFMSLAE